MQRRRLLNRLVRGDLANVKFKSITDLAEGFGFRLVRTKGSHHIFSHASIPGVINLQEANSDAKPYQIRQLLRLVERYNLKLEDD